MVVGLSLVLKGESAVAHVVEILEPLEEGNSDASSVQVEVGDHQAVVLLQNSVSCRRCWSIGCLTNNLKKKNTNISVKYSKRYIITIYSVSYNNLNFNFGRFRVIKRML